MRHLGGTTAARAGAQHAAWGRAGQEPRLAQGDPAHVSFTKVRLPPSKQARLTVQLPWNLWVFQKIENTVVF